MSRSGRDASGSKDGFRFRRPRADGVFDSTKPDTNTATTARPSTEPRGRVTAPPSAPGVAGSAGVFPAGPGTRVQPYQTSHDPTFVVGAAKGAHLHAITAMSEYAAHTFEASVASACCSALYNPATTNPRLLLPPSLSLPPFQFFPLIFDFIFSSWPHKSTRVAVPAAGRAPKRASHHVHPRLHVGCQKQELRYNDYLAGLSPTHAPSDFSFDAPVWHNGGHGGHGGHASTEPSVPTFVFDKPSKAAELVHTFAGIGFSVGSAGAEKDAYMPRPVAAAVEAGFSFARPRKMTRCQLRLAVQYRGGRAVFCKPAPVHAVAAPVPEPATVAQQEPKTFKPFKGHTAASSPPTRNPTPSESGGFPGAGTAGSAEKDAQYDAWLATMAAKSSFVFDAPGTGPGTCQPAAAGSGVTFVGPGAIIKRDAVLAPPADAPHTQPSHMPTQHNEKLPGAESSKGAGAKAAPLCPPLSFKFAFNKGQRLGTDLAGGGASKQAAQAAAPSLAKNDPPVSALAKTDFKFPVALRGPAGAAPGLAAAVGAAAGGQARADLLGTPKPSPFSFAATAPTVEPPKVAQQKGTAPLDSWEAATRLCAAKMRLSTLGRQFAALAPSTSTPTPTPAGDTPETKTLLEALAAVTRDEWRLEAAWVSAPAVGEHVQHSVAMYLFAVAGSPHAGVTDSVLVKLLSVLGELKRTAGIDVIGARAAGSGHAGTCLHHAIRNAPRIPPQVMDQLLCEATSLVGVEWAVQGAGRDIFSTAGVQQDALFTTHASTSAVSAAVAKAAPGANESHVNAALAQLSCAVLELVEGPRVSGKPLFKSKERPTYAAKAEFANPSRANVFTYGLSQPWAWACPQKSSVDDSDHQQHSSRIEATLLALLDVGGQKSLQSQTGEWCSAVLFTVLAGAAQKWAAEVLARVVALGGADYLVHCDLPVLKLRPGHSRGSTVAYSPTRAAYGAVAMHDARTNATGVRHYFTKLMALRVPFAEAYPPVILAVLAQASHLSSAAIHHILDVGGTALILGLGVDGATTCADAAMKQAGFLEKAVITKLFGACKSNVDADREAPSYLGERRNRDWKTARPTRETRFPPTLEGRNLPARPTTALHVALAHASSPKLDQQLVLDMIDDYPAHMILTSRKNCILAYALSLGHAASTSKLNVSTHAPTRFPAAPLVPARTAGPVSSEACCVPEALLSRLIGRMDTAVVNDARHAAPIPDTAPSQLVYKDASHLIKWDAKQAARAHAEVTNNGMTVSALNGYLPVLANKAFRVGQHKWTLRCASDTGDIGGIPLPSHAIFGVALKSIRHDVGVGDTSSWQSDDGSQQQCWVFDRRQQPVDLKACVPDSTPLPFDDSSKDLNVPNRRFISGPLAGKPAPSTERRPSSQGNGQPIRTTRTPKVYSPVARCVQRRAHTQRRLAEPSRPLLYGPVALKRERQRVMDLVSSDTVTLLLDCDRGTLCMQTKAGRTVCWSGDMFTNLPTGGEHEFVPLVACHGMDVSITLEPPADHDRTMPASEWPPSALSSGAHYKLEPGLILKNLANNRHPLKIERISGTTILATSVNAGGAGTGHGRLEHLEIGQYGKTFVAKKYCSMIASLHAEAGLGPEIFFSSGAASQNDNGLGGQCPTGASSWARYQLPDIIHRDYCWEINDRAGRTALSGGQRGHRLLLTFRQGFQIGSLKLHYLKGKGLVDLRKVVMHVHAGDRTDMLERVAEITPTPGISTGHSVSESASYGSVEVLAAADVPVPVRFVCVEIVTSGQASHAFGSEATQISIMNVSATPHTPVPVLNAVVCQTQNESRFALEAPKEHHESVVAALCRAALQMEGSTRWGRQLVIGPCTLQGIAKNGFALSSTVLENVLDAAGEELLCSAASRGVSFAQLMFEHRATPVLNNVPKADAPLTVPAAKPISSTSFFRLLRIIGTACHTLTSNSSGFLLLESAMANIDSIPAEVLDYLLTHNNGEQYRKAVATQVAKKISTRQMANADEATTEFVPSTAAGLLHMALKKTTNWRQFVDTHVATTTVLITVDTSEKNLILNQGLIRWLQNQFHCAVECKHSPLNRKATTLTLTSTRHHRHHHHHMGHGQDPLAHSAALVQRAAAALHQIFGIPVGLARTSVFAQGLAGTKQTNPPTAAAAFGTAATSADQRNQDEGSPTYAAKLLRIIASLQCEAVLQRDAEGLNALHVALTLQDALPPSHRAQVLHKIIDLGGSAAALSVTEAGFSAPLLALAYAKYTPQSVLLRLMRLGKATLARNVGAAPASAAPVSWAAVALSKVELLRGTVLVDMVDLLDDATVATTWPLLQLLNVAHRSPVANRTPGFQFGGLQNRMPTATAAVATATDEPDKAMVDQLAEMGFSLEGCKKAVMRHPTDLAAATTWVLQHYTEPDFGTPVDAPAADAPTPTPARVQTRHKQESSLQPAKEQVTQQVTTFDVVGRAMVKVLDRLENTLVAARDDESVWKNRDKERLANPRWSRESHAWRSGSASTQFVKVCLLCTHRAVPGVGGVGGRILEFLLWDDMTEVVRIAKKLKERNFILVAEPDNDPELVQMVSRSAMRSLDAAAAEALTETDKLLAIVERGGRDLPCVDWLDGNTPLVSALATVRLRPLVVNMLIDLSSEEVVCQAMMNTPTEAHAVGADMVGSSPLVLALHRELPEATLLALLDKGGIGGALKQDACGKYLPSAVIANIKRDFVSEELATKLVELVWQACDPTAVLCAAFSNPDMPWSILETLVDEQCSAKAMNGDVLAAALNNAAHLPLPLLKRVVDESRTSAGLCAGLDAEHDQNALYLAIDLAESIPHQFREELLLHLLATGGEPILRPRNVVEHDGGRGARVRARDGQGGWKSGTIVTSSFSKNFQRSPQHDVQPDSGGNVHVAWDTPGVAPGRRPNDTNTERFLVSKHDYPFELSDLPCLHFALLRADTVPETVILQIIHEGGLCAVSAQDAFGRTPLLVAMHNSRHVSDSIIRALLDGSNDVVLRNRGIEGVTAWHAALHAADRLEPETLQRLFSRLSDDQMVLTADRHTVVHEALANIRSVPRTILQDLLCRSSRISSHKHREQLLNAHSSREDFQNLVAHMDPTAGHAGAFGGLNAINSAVSNELPKASIFEDVILMHKLNISFIPEETLETLSQMVGLDRIVQSICTASPYHCNYFLTALHAVDHQQGFLSEALLVSIIKHGGLKFAKLRSAQHGANNTFLHILLAATPSRNLDAVILLLLDVGGKEILGPHMASTNGPGSIPIFHSAITNAEHIGPAVFLRLLELGGRLLLQENHNGKSGRKFAIENAEHVHEEVLAAIIDCADGADVGDTLFNALQHAQHVPPPLLAKLAGRCTKKQLATLSDEHLVDHHHHHHHHRLRQPESIFIAALMSAEHISNDILSTLLKKGREECLFTWNSSMGPQGFHSPLYHAFANAQHLSNSFLEQLLLLAPRSLFVHQPHHAATETPLHAALSNCEHVSLANFFLIIEKGGQGPANFEELFSAQFDSVGNRKKMSKVFVRMADVLQKDPSEVVNRAFSDADFGKLVRCSLMKSWTPAEHAWRASGAAPCMFVRTLLLIGNRLDDIADAVPIGGPVAICLSADLWLKILSFCSYAELDNLKLLGEQLISSLGYVRRAMERTRTSTRHHSGFVCSYPNGCPHESEFAHDRAGRQRTHWRCCGDPDSETTHCLGHGFQHKAPLSSEELRMRELDQLAMIQRGGTDLVVQQDPKGCSMLSVAIRALKGQRSTGGKEQENVVSCQVLLKLIEVRMPRACLAASL